MTPLSVTLADLVARLDRELSEASDLERISEAHLRARILSGLGDQLVGHYVSEARQAGASWSEIGDAIGVSKQAAQQRHAPSAFSGFTDLSRHSVVLAQETARSHRHNFIGTIHLLLGLLGETRGLAYQLLTASTGSEDGIRQEIKAMMPPPGRRSPRGHIAFAPESVQALDLARKASSGLGCDRVGTEHLLLGLIGVEDAAAVILRNLGFTPDGLRASVNTPTSRAHRSVRR